MTSDDLAAEDLAALRPFALQLALTALHLAFVLPLRDQAPMLAGFLFAIYLAISYRLVRAIAQSGPRRSPDRRYGR